MSSKIRFGTWETVAMMMNIICMQIFIGFPRIMAESAGTAGWIQTIYLSLLILIGFAIISMLYKKFNGMDIIEISDYLGGATIRLIIGLMYSIYAMFALVITLREFAENMKTVALPQSPLSFIIIFFSVAMILGGYLGIETIGRFSAFIVPIIFLGYVVILLAVFPYYETANIMPILGNGPYQIFIKGLSRISVFSGITVLYIIQPYLGDYKTFTKSGYMCLVLSAIALTLGSLCYQLIYPYPSSTQSFLPIYSMARQIYYGRFFQRVEAVFVFIWAAAGMSYLSAVFFVILNMLKKTFKLEHSKPLVLPMMIISFTLSLFPKSLMSIIRMESLIFRNYAWIMAVALPILILAAACLKKSGQNKEEKKQC